MEIIENIGEYIARQRDEVVGQALDEIGSVGAGVLNISEIIADRQGSVTEYEPDAFTQVETTTFSGDSEASNQDETVSISEKQSEKREQYERIATARRDIESAQTADTEQSSNVVSIDEYREKKAKLERSHE